MIKKNNNLIQYAAIGGGLVLAYALVDYLSKRSPKPKPLPLQLTKKILQQVKFQMISNSLSYALGAEQKLKSQKKQRDLQIGMRNQLANICQTRQDAILKKYDVSRQEYSWSLEYHKNDKSIVQNQKQIIKMMENAIKGQKPDLTVPRQISQKYNHEKSIQIYRKMIIEILQKLWQHMVEYRRQHPNFNYKNDIQFQAAIKGFNIYEIKVNYLKQQGFDVSWGCPNQLFLKLIQGQKLKDQGFKQTAKKIQRAYQKLMTQVTSNSQSLTKDRIQLNFKQLEQQNPVNTLNASLINKKQQVPQKLPEKTFFGSAPIVKKPQQTKQLSQQQQLQRMMMQQLMNRSQQVEKQEVVQQPKEQKKQQNQVSNIQQKVQTEAKEVNTKDKENKQQNIQRQQIKEQIKNLINQNQVEPETAKTQQVKPQNVESVQKKEQIPEVNDKVEEKVVQPIVQIPQVNNKIEQKVAEPIQENKPTDIEQKQTKIEQNETKQVKEQHKQTENKQQVNDAN